MSIPRLCSIDDYWSEVERGLAVVRRKAPSNWTPKSIRKACHERRAFFFKVPEGFFILRPRANPTRVHIDVAYGTGGNLIRRYEPHIERLARDIGAVALTFESTRPGYRRAMRHWVRDGNQYTRTLS